MPKLLSQARIALKILRQIGFGQVALYALYRLELLSGWLELKTRRDVARASRHPASTFTLFSLLHLPDPQAIHLILGESGLASLLDEADEIVAGKVRLFGAEPVPMDLSQGSSTLPWTIYASGRVSFPIPDVKFLWEPARFGWAFTLGRAYLLSGDERYPQAFWHNVNLFLDAHSINIGPHWVSAQEVALRILAFVWGAQVFSASPSTTPERLTSLGKVVAAHAARIPATLSYARSQNNNHLLSEAVGLLTAGLSLREHPQASHWSALGWRWLNRGLLEQISTKGTYVQHSTSYHRLMLQLTLWVHWISQSDSHTFPSPVLARLSVATSWLLALLDQASGSVPNLGPNDGANILPLTVCPQLDYRPVLQAASQAFIGKRGLPSGLWDELSLWLGLQDCRNILSQSSRNDSEAALHILHNPNRLSWAYLRGARFTSRPGHADQLHLDLWWNGLNIAQDAGTFSYNAPPPWNNSLTHTAVHNTLVVDEKEQMSRTGKFLYLDWAQTQIDKREFAHDNSWQSLTAWHDGYKRLGVSHQRTVIAQHDGNWLIEDLLQPVSQPNATHLLRLHWLVPDWPWESVELSDHSYRIDLDSPHGQINLHLGIAGTPPSTRVPRLLIVRAGEALSGRRDVSPTWGWVSPTYGFKLPALSVSIEVVATLPIMLTSRWILPTSLN